MLCTLRQPFGPATGRLAGSCALLCWCACGESCSENSAEPPLFRDKVGYLDFDDFFSFDDGEESWTLATDAHEPERLAVTVAPVAADLYLMTWSRQCELPTKDCVSTPLRTVEWYVSPEEIGITGWAAGPDEPWVSFDPMLRVVIAETTPGDSVSTTLDDQVFTSTYLGFVECPTMPEFDWGDDCIAFDLDDGDEDPATYAGLVGTIWLMTHFDLTGWQSDTDPAPWRFAGYDCVGDGC